MAGVNRSLADPDMDDIDHALGRPRDPLGETYRNHYVAPADSEVAEHMRWSFYWSEGKPMNGGRDVLFTVTQMGREALAKHLAEATTRREGEMDTPVSRAAAEFWAATFRHWARVAAWWGVDEYARLYSLVADRCQDEAEKADRREG